MEGEAGKVYQITDLNHAHDLARNVPSHVSDLHRRIRAQDRG
jgi:hypothetical protein